MRVNSDTKLCNQVHQSAVMKKISLSFTLNLHLYKPKDCRLPPPVLSCGESSFIIYLQRNTSHRTLFLTLSEL